MREAELSVETNYQPGDPAPGYPASKPVKMGVEDVAHRHHVRVHSRTIRWPIDNPNSLRFTF